MKRVLIYLFMLSVAGCDDQKPIVVPETPVVVPPPVHKPPRLSTKQARDQFDMAMFLCDKLKGQAQFDCVDRAIKSLEASQ